MLIFLAHICPKIDLGLEIQKTNVKNNHQPRDTMCANFQANQTTLTSLAQSLPKIDLGLEILKTNVGIRTSSFEIRCVPIFR